MQRYFIDQVLTLDEVLQLPMDIAHHVFDVMRGKLAEQIYLVDTQQQLFIGKIVALDKTQPNIQVIEQLESDVELPISVAIACGLSKGDKLEWIAQKGTECGMSNFYPLALSRDVMKWEAKKSAKKIERLNKIVQEAAEQSHRLKVPTVHDLSHLDEFIHQAAQYSIKLIAYEEVAKVGEHAQLKQLLTKIKQDDRILMVFGSEGGLSEQEVSKLKAAGFIACSLGPRILRAETAPIYFLSAVSYQIEL